MSFREARATRNPLPSCLPCAVEPGLTSTQKSGNDVNDRPNDATDVNDRPNDATDFLRNGTNDKRLLRLSRYRRLSATGARMGFPVHLIRQYKKQSHLIRQFRPFIVKLTDGIISSLSSNALVNPPGLFPVGLNRLLAYSNLFLAGRSS